MIAGDRISTFLGAPPNKWKKAECEQVKQIHRCYRNAFNSRNDEDQVDVRDASRADFEVVFGDKAAKLAPGTRNLVDKKNTSGNAQDGGAVAAAVEGEGEKEAEDKKDEEWYLPKDSPLRSKDGDKKAPLNPTFKDHESFVRSCEIDFWRENFEGQSQDRFLSETAETVVSNICTAQARGELRVNKGAVPLRKNREQITPLALCLHEMKLWATHRLRGASVFEEETYKELKYRSKYIEALSHKEVWGDPAIFLAAGMRPVAHDKLFRLLLTTKEALDRAHEYAYRGYCRRSSREKLARLGNLLKNVVLREMRILSAINTLEMKLSDAKTPRLQPTDLLNSIQNQGFVDYKNMVNVLMYKLCQNPLMRAALTGDYDKDDVKSAIDKLDEWTKSNLFCLPATDGFDTEPEFLLDPSKECRILPAIYNPTAAELKKLIKENDPRAATPRSGKKHVQALTNAYDTIEAAETVVKLMMKTAAAIQELVPSLYATHTLWGIAGDGGDFTVYDTLRDEVIKVMSNSLERVYTLQQTEKSLLKEIGILCKTKEETMVKKQLRTGKLKFKPAWIMNYKFLNTDILPASRKGLEAAKIQLLEISRDAWEYNLSSDQLDDKVQQAKKMVQAITGGKATEDAAEPIKKTFSVKDIVDMGKGSQKDWLHSDERSGDDIFGQSNQFDMLDAKSKIKAEENKFAFDDDADVEAEPYNPFEQDSDDGY